MGGIDIVVVNYRTPGDLLAFTRSLYRSKVQRPFRLFIFNVAPHPEDLRMGFLLEEEHANTFHLHVRENVGYSGAVNAAVFASGGFGAQPLVGFFNADTRLAPGVVDENCDLLEGDDLLGVVGPRQVDERGMITAAGIFGTNEDPQDRGFHQPDCAEYHDVRDDAVSLSGSAIFTTRDVWDQMTMCKEYDKTFPGVLGALLPTPHYYEEMGYIYHLRHHGYLACYNGESKMIHKWHTASRVGGYAERTLPTSREMFEDFCDGHGIARP